MRDFLPWAICDNRGNIARAWAACITIALTRPTVAEDLPTFQEAAAGYRQNLADGLPFSVEWIVTQFELPAAIDLDIANNEVLRRMIVATSDTAIRSRLEEKLAEDEQKVIPESQGVRLAKKSRRHFFWTDGKRIHYRYSDNTDEQLGGDFGSAPTGAFGHINIYSFDPNRSPKLRVWQGYASDEKTLTGYVATQGVGGFVDRSYLPPLGFVKEDWKASQRFSSLDKWTDRTAGAQEATNGIRLGNDDTLLIHNAVGDETLGVDRVSVWLVSNKGFVPKRIALEYSGGPATASPSAEYPVRRSEVIEVDEVVSHDGVFYPNRVTSTRYGVDAEWYSNNPGIADSGTFVPYVPIAVRIEDILSVEIRKHIPQSWIDLPFPTGTRYLDMDSNEMYLEGTPKEEFDRQLVAELTRNTGATPLPLGKRRSSVSWVIMANVAGIILLALIYTYARAKRRQHS